MIQDKEGNEVSLEQMLWYLTGTDENDDARSVMDFAVYKLNDDNTLGDPTYYLVATEAIVTQVSFMGPFTMVEVDFRNIGVNILNQVMAVIDRFHSDINTEKVVMVSTITSLDEKASHIMSAMNPIVCIRGYSQEGEGSTLMQLIYATDNVGFSFNKIDFVEIQAELDREFYEQESMLITQEAEAAGYDGVSENDAEMQDMFNPEFGMDFDGVMTPEERFRENGEGGNVRVSGFKERDKDKKDKRVGGNESVKITGYDEDKEDS